MFLTQNTPRSPLARAHRMGGDARAMTIAAWLRTLVGWNVSLERAAEMIEAGVPWGDSEQPVPDVVADERADQIPEHIVEAASRAYVARPHASINDRIVDALLAIDLPSLLVAADADQNDGFGTTD